MRVSGEVVKDEKWQDFKAVLWAMSFGKFSLLPFLICKTCGFRHRVRTYLTRNFEKIAVHVFTIVEGVGFEPTQVLS